MATAFSRFFHKSHLKLFPHTTWYFRIHRCMSVKTFQTTVLAQEYSGKCSRNDLCTLMGLGVGCVNQAYSRLSIPHGHITDCKMDSVVYAGVCVVSSYGVSLFGRCMLHFNYKV